MDRAGLLVGSAIVALLCPVPAMAETVGVTSAVNPDTFGTPPQADTRTLYLGDAVFFEELIETGPDGRAQVMLVDQSAFSVGPNARMVLDSFVYDPETSTGELTATISEGVFRFVGGALSKNDGAVTFNTPNATVGVRGGIVTIEIEPETGDQIITLAYGEVVVIDAQGNRRRLVEPGYQVIVSSDGISSVPQRSDGQGAQRVVADLTGTPGAAGPDAPDAETIELGLVQAEIVQIEPADTSAILGTTTGGTDVLGDALATETVQDSTEAVLDGNVAGAPPPPDTTVTPTNPALPVTGLFAAASPQFELENGAALANAANQGHVGSGDLDLPDYLQTFDRAVIDDGALVVSMSNGGSLRLPYREGSLAISDGSATYAGSTKTLAGSAYIAPDNQFFVYNLFVNGDVNQPVFIEGGTPFDPTQAFPDGGLRFYALLPDAREGSAIPFTNADLYGLTDAGVVSSPLYVIEQSSGPLGRSADSTAMLHATVKMEGRGPGQSSAMVVIASPTFFDQDGLFGVNTARRGTLRPESDSRRVIGYSGRVDTINAGTADVFGENAEFFVLGDRPQPGGDFFDTTAISVPDNTRYNEDLRNPSTRHVAILVGEQARSTLTRTLDQGDGIDLRGYSAALMGSSYDAEIHQSKGNNLGVTPFIYRSRDAADGTPGLWLDFNSSGENNLSARIDLEDTADLDEDNLARRTFVFGPTDAGFGASAYVDDDRYGAFYNRDETVFYGDDSGIPRNYDGNPNTFFISGSLAPTTAFYEDGVTPCACDFLEWGWWGGRTGFVDNDPAVQDFRNDFFHFAPWVAGQPATLADIIEPPSGIATYSGSAIANVFQGQPGFFGDNYVSGGSFSLDWDFGSRSGTGTIGLDGRTLTYAVAGPGGTNFDGSLTSGAAAGKMQGSFFKDPGASTGVGPAGDFYALDNAAEWRAAGIFMGQEE